MIYFNIPWDNNKNIGQAYNRFMEMLPNDDDYACFIDGDAMFLHPFFGKQLEDIVAKHPDVDCFTGLTNRVGCTWQLGGAIGSDDIKDHREFANLVYGLHYDEIVPVKEGCTPMSGVLILLKKSSWKDIGGFKNGMLGVDNQLHIDLQDHNKNIALMSGVYVYHWYRGGDRSNKKHLEGGEVVKPKGRTADEVRILTERYYKKQQRKETDALAVPREKTIDEIEEGYPERTRLINRYIRTFKYHSYLEIGTQNKDNNFNKVIAEHKVCVDPDPMAEADYVMGSDDFFAINKNKFDIIFIDGLHESEQVKRDIINSLAYLNDGGVILIHDCLPKTEEEQLVPRFTKVWTGDVWKALVYFKKYPDLDVDLLDIETGIGVIKRGKQQVRHLENISFQEYRDIWQLIFPKKKKIIYSAITGGYDRPLDHVIPPGWEYKLFTNNKDIQNSIYIESDHLSDVKLARHIKICPWEYFDFDVCVWIDGNTTFDPAQIEELTNYEFVISKHSERDCTYDEGAAILNFKKETPEMINRILLRYRTEGLPDHAGMVASHAIVRWNTEKVKDFCYKWWNEVLLGTHRDQMSFNYLLWKYPIDVFFIKFRTIFQTTSIHRNKIN